MHLVHLLMAVQAAHFFGQFAQMVPSKNSPSLQQYPDVTDPLEQLWQSLGLGPEQVAQLGSHDCSTSMTDLVSEETVNPFNAPDWKLNESK